MNKITPICCLIASTALLAATRAPAADHAGERASRGRASWHAGGGDRTASGERWQTEDFMAAHRSLPLGSNVRVVNVRNGRSTIVRITDRGPFTRGRIIDLSRAAARAIGILDSGTGEVRIETLPPAPDRAAKPSP